MPDAADRFDPDLIEQYRIVIGPSGAREMVELFLRTLAERRAELGVAVAAHDLAEVRRLGHALKGMAGAVGAVRLSAAGGALQDADAGDLSALLVDLDTEAASAIAGVGAAWSLTEP